MTRNSWYAVGGVFAGGVLLAGVVAAGPTWAHVSANRAAGPQAGAGAGVQGLGPAQAASAQFMEIKSGELRDGRVYLQVRPADKEHLGESFRTVPIPGPYTEVVLTPNARILYLDGESGSHEVFVDLLARRSPDRPGHVTPDERVEGFDLTFDGQNQVSTVEWRYVPSPVAAANASAAEAPAAKAPAGKAPAAKAPAAKAAQHWVNGTHFMEIKSSELRNGLVYLQVRPATKQHLGESFTTVPVPGPYTEVVLTPNARILYLNGESGSHEVFVGLLAKRSPDTRIEGFDLTFDGRGEISQVDWVYVP